MMTIHVMTSKQTKLKQESLGKNNNPPKTNKANNATVVVLEVILRTIVIRELTLIVISVEEKIIFNRREIES